MRARMLAPSPLISAVNGGTWLDKSGCTAGAATPQDCRRTLPLALLDGVRVVFLTVTFADLAQGFDPVSPTRSGLAFADPG